MTSFAKYMHTSALAACALLLLGGCDINRSPHYPEDQKDFDEAPIPAPPATEDADDGTSPIDIGPSAPTSNSSPENVVQREDSPPISDAVSDPRAEDTPTPPPAESPAPKPFDRETDVPIEPEILVDRASFVPALDLESFTLLDKHGEAIAIPSSLQWLTRRIGRWVFGSATSNPDDRIDVALNLKTTPAPAFQKSVDPSRSGAETTRSRTPIVSGTAEVVIVVHDAPERSGVQKVELGTPQPGQCPAFLLCVKSLSFATQAASVPPQTTSYFDAKTGSPAVIPYSPMPNAKSPTATTTYGPFVAKTGVPAVDSVSAPMEATKFVVDVGPAPKFLRDGEPPLQGTLLVVRLDPSEDSQKYLNLYSRIGMVRHKAFYPSSGGSSFVHIHQTLDEAFSPKGRKWLLALRANVPFGLGYLFRRVEGYRVSVNFDARRAGEP